MATSNAKETNMSETQDRREFLKTAAMVGAGMALGSLAGTARAQDADRLSKVGPGTLVLSNSKSMAGFAAPKLETIRVGFVGVGGRGTGDLDQMLRMEG